MTTIGRKLEWKACEGCGDPTVELVEGKPTCANCAAVMPWHCPDPSCTYSGTPSIHILNLPAAHQWSAGQVADHIHKRRKKYPYTWDGSEGQ